MEAKITGYKDPKIKSCGCSCGCGHSESHSLPEEVEESGLKAWGAPAVSLSMLMAGMVMTHRHLSFFTDNVIVQLIWYVVAFLPVGLPVLKEAMEGIARKDFFNEFTLMSIACIGAFCIREFPEGVGVMLFYSVGEMLQDRAVDKAKRNISSLLDLRPDKARVKRQESFTEVDPVTVAIGETIDVRRGERVPLDGILQNESGVFDTSALTGESEPRTILKGEAVLSGMISLSSAVELTVDKEYGESALSRILEMVTNASSRKAQSELFIRKFARVYTPAVMALAILLVGVPWIVSLAHPGFHYVFSEWLYRALVFLVISCPCALVISVPLSYFAGIGAASRAGILFKGGNYLEAIRKVNTVSFDKTGTLTTGEVSADALKPDAEEAVKSLSRMGVDRIIMLSGDRKDRVGHFASKLGIQEAYGELLPEDKVAHVEEETRKPGRVVAFVGDGINDAPVLALSHVGIAMGGLGTDSAIQSADVVIQTDQPSRVATAIRIGRATHTIVMENIVGAIAIKVAILILGAMGMASLWAAVFADVGVALLAVLNSMRLMWKKF